MRRLGKVNVSIPAYRYEELPDKCKHLYNCSIHTNHTVKQPYFCPYGKSICRRCSKKCKSGSFIRKQMKQHLHIVVKNNYIEH